jgi:hypothetical protein
MTNPTGPNTGPNQHNNQTNKAYGRGTIYSSQGGSQHVNHITNQASATRSWAGWATLVVIGVDVAFFFYGMTAYTGQPSNSGDLWRAGIFIVLLVTTGSLIRRWLRRRL